MSEFTDSVDKIAEGIRANARTEAERAAAEQRLGEERRARNAAETEPLGREAANLLTTRGIPGIPLAFDHEIRFRRRELPWATARYRVLSDVRAWYLGAVQGEPYEDLQHDWVLTSEHLALLANGRYIFVSGQPSAALIWDWELRRMRPVHSPILHEEQFDGTSSIYLDVKTGPAPREAVMRHREAMHHLLLRQYGGGPHEIVEFEWNWDKHQEVTGMAGAPTHNGAADLVTSAVARLIANHE
jgi:hypothetical protein